ncbi:hypothetical protein AeMF1_012494 [Aphanomyces euteiches]|nr:hypothetical protein AeMF1_012494 [Aphanomyces euteiches]
MQVYASNKHATSAQAALEMQSIRAIIEREACLEALQQLATEFANPMSKTRPWKLVHNLTLQYRKASVETIEAIRKWQLAHGHAVASFMWKKTNYLHKMTTDCAFFSTAKEMLRDLDYPLESNPLLAPVTLDDPLLREQDNPMALLQAARRRCTDNVVGGVEIDRICAALKCLFVEVNLHPPGMESESNNDSGSVAPSESPPQLPDEPATMDKTQQMQNHLDHAKQAVARMEQERQELKTQMQQLQTKMEAATTPNKLRTMQTKYSAWNNELKSLMGELYKRRNELARLDAAFKMHRSSTTKKKPASVINEELHQVVQADCAARDRLLASLELPPPPSGACALEEMTPAAVADMVRGLGLEAAAEKLQAMSIDGGLLSISTDADLQEIGIDIRLHRVKILRHVEKVLKTR